MIFGGFKVRDKIIKLLWQITQSVYFISLLFLDECILVHGEVARKLGVLLVELQLAN